MFSIVQWQGIGNSRIECQVKDLEVNSKGDGESLEVSMVRNLYEKYIIV